MKESIKKTWNSVKETVANGLETARSTGLPKKIVMVIAGLSFSILAVFLLLKALGNLFDAVTIFIDRRFFGVAGTAIAGSYMICRHNERKEERKRLRIAEQRGMDSQKERFCKGAYTIIGKFLFSEICNSGNFSELTSCQRPIRPEDMGNADLDSYTYMGTMYDRYTIPKINADSLDTSLVASIIQGLIDQKIRTRGLPPLIERGENRHLYVDKIEDMTTYINATFVLDFDDLYVQKLAYDNAMAEVINRSAANRALEDIDYHG